MVERPRPVLSIWAHYDDDLIFGCPTIDAAVAAGAAVTTLFLTASDAGRDSAYVAGREEGLRLAYERMHGSALSWRTRTRTLGGGAAATIWDAASAPIALMTLGLPDGRPNGSGFDATGNVSLRQVLEGTAESIAPIAGGEPLTAPTLATTLADVLHEHRDGRILAHAPASAGEWAERDHSDHWSTGEFVRRAAAIAGLDERGVSWRIGYPSARLPESVAPAALDRKVEVFRTYAAHDPVVARPDAAATLGLRGFGDWLRREYELLDGVPAPVVP